MGPLGHAHSHTHTLTPSNLRITQTVQFSRHLRFPHYSYNIVTCVYMFVHRAFALLPFRLALKHRQMDTNYMICTCNVQDGPECPVPDPLETRHGPDKVTNTCAPQKHHCFCTQALPALLADSRGLPKGLSLFTEYTPD